MELTSSWVLFLAAALLALAIRGLVLHRYQRCPHCRGWVKRARRGWLRCPRCGRQYHRSVVRL